jgi:hypothetical protein
MFKVTNDELIQIAAVDAGLDPFAEYATKGVWKAAGYRVQAGQKPALVVDLWCPRQAKGESDSLSNPDSSVSAESQQAAIPGLFFTFKTCHLYTREQVVEAQEADAQKEADRHKREQKKAFRRAILPEGIAPSADYECIPRWAKRKDGIPIDVAVAQVQAAGFAVEDANGLYELLQAM